jgi:hypothetical protein
MENLNIFLDFALVMVGLWMVYIAYRVELGGIMGHTITFVTLGALLLGFAHLTETIMMGVFENVVFNELIHRIIILGGFLLLVQGFRKLSNLQQA